MYYDRSSLLFCSNLSDFIENVNCGIFTPCPFILRLLTQPVNYSIVYLGTQHARFPPKFYYWTFIACDLLSLILQATGGALSSVSSGGSKAAVDVAIAGLSFQVFTLIIFILLAAEYGVRYQKAGGANAQLPTKFKSFLGFLSLSILCILIRCIYRIDELSDGYNGPLIHDQGLFIGLEGV